MRGAGMDGGGYDRGWAWWPGMWGEDRAERRRWVDGLEQEEVREGKKKEKPIPLTCGSHM